MSDKKDLSWLLEVLPKSKDEFAIWALEDTEKRMRKLKKHAELILY